MRDKEHWLCVGCNKDTFKKAKDYYMVTHELWEKHGVEEGMLCMKCFESRLGRKLIRSDILLCPLTTMENPYTMKILSKK